MSTTYKIKVDRERKIGKIDKNIYGHFIEHLGRCIYGGIYEEDSPLSDNNGFRKDILEAVKKIKCPILRWPGGNFASNYHWEDGIGPKDKRPVRFDLAWQAEESNRFGTDEFIAYCRKVGTEPYICNNIGTGNLDETINWLQYCNSPGNTEYANLRKKMGHEEPFKVKYWGVGNETYGNWQVGHMSAREYARVLREYAQFMKKVDPEIKIIAVGADNPEWDMEVISVAGEHIDYISNHQYLGSDSYYGTVGSVYQVEKRLKMLDGVIKAFQPEGKDIKIALDEWNIWYRTGQEEGLEENYALKDGIFAAGVFIILHKLCNRVTMANLAQLVNVIGAIHTNKEGMFLTPIYHAFDLFVNHTGDIALDTLVTSDTYNVEEIIRPASHPMRVKLDNLPYLDASATLSADEHTLFLAVLNYHEKEAISSPIYLEGFGHPNNEGKVFELNGPGVNSMNDFDNPDKVGISTKQMKNVGSHFTYTFPPHSATVIEIKCNQK